MGLSGFAGRWLAIGAVLMLIGVAFGAFGAHVATGRLTPRELEIFRTGVSYHQLHAFGLMLIAIAARETTVAESALRTAVWLMLAGILLFSGSLYALALGAPRALGMVTPLGGTAFMLAWALVAWHAVRKR